ncbi:MAG: LUD domain-containing protein [Bacteroidia bacterium]|nr:LUD domain-containing protein [Bacteroidia bacterium]
MEDSKSREKILKKVRAALIQGVPENPANLDIESEIYVIPPESPEEVFARQFTALNGKFLFCENTTDAAEVVRNLVNENGWTGLFSSDQFIHELLFSSGLTIASEEKDLISSNVGITGCECLVARLGAVLISSKQASGRRLPVYPHYHLVIAFTDQIVMNMKDGLKLIRERYKGELPSMISSIAGPSRTADIEKTLVQGAHGPKEIYVILIDRN